MGGSPGVGSSTPFCNPVPTLGFVPETSFLAVWRSGEDGRVFRSWMLSPSVSLVCLFHLFTTFKKVVFPMLINYSFAIL